MEDAKVAIQGFGNVGYHAAKSLQGIGARIIAITNSYGGVYNNDVQAPQQLANLNLELEIEYEKGLAAADELNQARVAIRELTRTLEK